MSSATPAAVVKFARLRLSFPDEPLSPVQAALADCDGLRVARLRFGGVTPGSPRTYVLSVRGDPAAVERALAARSAVEECELVSEEGVEGVVYVRAQAGATELALTEAFTRDSLVTTLPVDFRPDGSAVFRVLGESGDLRAAVDEVRGALPVTVERVGDYDGRPADGAAGVTDRQAEVVRTALDLGYYAVPREATHEDVAAALDCAPATASEHLQKAERALVRSVFE